MSVVRSHETGWKPLAQPGVGIKVQHAAAGPHRGAVGAAVLLYGKRAGKLPP
jgi:hypothetical protein